MEMQQSHFSGSETDEEEQSSFTDRTASGEAVEATREVPLSLPTMLVSSVIRSTHQGESHGGVYLVDLERGDHRQLLDWDDPTISWEGRGADRGLRGIAFYDEHVYVAASDEIFVFEPDFTLVDSFGNPYLEHCHEIDVYDGRLYLTSTGFDSILEVDLETHRFRRGFLYRMSGLRYAASRIPRHLPMGATRVTPSVRVFDPESEAGPSPRDQLHINSVVASETGMYVSGRKIGALVRTAIRPSGTEAVTEVFPTPFGTHNVLPLSDASREGAVIMNDTNRDAVVTVDEKSRVVSRWDLPRYDEHMLEQNDLPEDHARQAFGRGLKVWKEFVIVGSSPATVTAYTLSGSEPVSSVTLTMDVRNAVHGLEVWPFN